MSWVPDSGDFSSLFDFGGSSAPDVSGGGAADVGGALTDGGGGDGTVLPDMAYEAAMTGDSASPLAALFRSYSEDTGGNNSTPNASAGDSLAAGSPGGARSEWNAAKDSQAANDQLGIGPSPASHAAPAGFLQQVMKGLGLSKDGSSGGIDLSDPKQLQQWMRLITGLGGIASAIFHRSPTGYKSTGDLLSASGGGAPGMNWNPSQQASANSFFNSAPTPWNQRQIQYASGNKPGLVVPGNHYAHGGGVHHGALSAVAGGQDDVIDAKVAPGEYVWDADSVSAAGDGDNAAGAARLDQLREALRAHKRSAPPDKIPPRARPLHHYLPGGKK